MTVSVFFILNFFQTLKATSTNPASFAATAIQLPADASFISTKSKETSRFIKFRNIFLFHLGILEPSTYRTVNWATKVKSVLKYQKLKNQTISSKNQQLHQEIIVLQFTIGESARNKSNYQMVEYALEFLHENGAR